MGSKRQKRGTKRNPAIFSLSERGLGFHSSIMSPHSDGFIETLLRSKLVIDTVERKTFPGGFISNHKIVPRYRLHLVLDGAIIYEKDEGATRCSTGHMSLFTAWNHRNFKIPDNSSCDLAWIGFSLVERNKPQHTILSCISNDLERDKTQFELIQRLTTGNQAPALRLEGELKALLSRFYHHTHESPEATTSVLQQTNKADKEIDNFISWLENHFSQPDALFQAQQRTHLSPQYIRKRFKDKTGMTLNAYLNMIRMRTARYYVHETTFSIQEIAHKVGLTDAKYFSRRYKAFWGHAPRRS